MESYILGVDIGNTNTVFGLFTAEEEGTILHHWRTATGKDRTSDELGVFLLSFLKTVSLEADQIRGFVYSSVVPSFNPVVERMAESYFRTKPVRVRHDAIPLEISYPRPHEVGEDRLVNAVAARTLHGEKDAIIIDLGTATTFCVLHDGTYFGGVIAPGLALSMQALAGRTAQLPTVDFVRPPSGVIGDSTIHAIQSGFFFGWAGLLKEIIAEIRNAHPDRTYTVIATGGYAPLLHGEIPELFDLVDPLLTLRGLKAIYRWLNR